MLRTPTNGMSLSKTYRIICGTWFLWTMTALSMGGGKDGYFKLELLPCGKLLRHGSTSASSPTISAIYCGRICLKKDGCMGFAYKDSDGECALVYAGGHGEWIQPPDTSFYRLSQRDDILGELVPVDFARVFNSTYLYYHATSTMVGLVARDYCSCLGSNVRLMEIHTQEEQNNMVALGAYSTGGFWQVTQAWLGARYVTGVFAWDSSGNPLPSSAPHYHSTFSTTSVNVGPCSGLITVLTALGKWRDYNCGSTAGDVMCQYF